MPSTLPGGETSDPGFLFRLASPHRPLEVADDRRSIESGSEVVLTPDQRVLARRFAVMAAVTFGLLLVLAVMQAIAIQAQSDRPSVERILRLAGVALHGPHPCRCHLGPLDRSTRAAPLARVLLVVDGSRRDPLLDMVVALGRGTITIPIGDRRDPGSSVCDLPPSAGCHRRLADSRSSAP